MKNQQGDFLKSCLESVKENDAKGFQETFCIRCKNMDCIHAKAWGDAFYRRVSTQPDRFFNPVFANPNDPKYRDIANFVDKVQEALRIEIANVQNDWTIPEIPILDGLKEKAKTEAQNQVFSAAQGLAKANDKELILPEPLTPTPVETIPNPVIEPVEPKTEVPTIPVSTPPTPKPGNTNVSPHGIMLGGGSEPPPLPKNTIQDPWALPTDKGVVVKPGAKIVLKG